MVGITSRSDVGKAASTEQRDKSLGIKKINAVAFNPQPSRPAEFPPAAGPVRRLNADHAVRAQDGTDFLKQCCRICNVLDHIAKKSRINRRQRESILGKRPRARVEIEIDHRPTDIIRRNVEADHTPTAPSCQRGEISKPATEVQQSLGRFGFPRQKMNDILLYCSGPATRFRLIQSMIVLFTQRSDSMGGITWMLLDQSAVDATKQIKGPLLRIG